LPEKSLSEASREILSGVTLRQAQGKLHNIDTDSEFFQM
jgi:hypothetical protein